MKILLLWRTTGVEMGRDRSELLETLRSGRKQAGDLLKDQISTADHREVQKAGPIVRATPNRSCSQKIGQ